MKTIAFLFLSSVIPLWGTAEMDGAVKDAIRNGAMAKVICRVVDDEGTPVSNATVHVWFSSYARHHDDADWLVDTDVNGLFVASHRTNEQMAWLVQKEGYYQTHGNIRFRERKVDGPRVIDGKWQPYGETRTVVLKRIRNLGVLKVPSCLVRVEATVPVYGEWLPFDLEKFDWAAPYGAGSHDDVLLRFRRRVTRKWMPGKTYMSFVDGCFNPKPNDTNIEDGHQLREILSRQGVALPCKGAFLPPHLYPYFSKTIIFLWTDWR